MSKYFLMYCAATSTTAKALTDWLREQGLDITCGISVDETYEGAVRWGATGKMKRKPKKIINKGTAIQVASDKWEFMNRMREAGIRIPQTWGPASPDIQFPCLGRKREHVGGTDVVRCIQRADIKWAVAKGSEFFSQYIPKAREYRLHVWGEGIIKASEKKRTNEDVEYDPWVWNLSTGYTFRVPEDRVPATTRFIAVQCVELAGLDFGAVDIIVGDDGYPYALEVNTAPGLGVDSSLEAYGKKILEAFGC